jgi:NAD(P)-dependent dehydrogenase (short-subunit alcohol dehydrogenase family)
MNVNVRGTIDLVRQVLPHMAATEPADKDGERGIIVMVSSSAAFDGQPGQGMCFPFELLLLRSGGRRKKLSSSFVEDARKRGGTLLPFHHLHDEYNQSNQTQS